MNRKQRRAQGQEQRKAGRAAPAAPDPALLHDAGIAAYRRVIAYKDVESRQRDRAIDLARERSLSSMPRLPSVADLHPLMAPAMEDAT